MHAAHIPISIVSTQTLVITGDHKAKENLATYITQAMSQTTHISLLSDLNYQATHFDQTCRDQVAHIRLRCRPDCARFSLVVYVERR